MEDTIILTKSEVQACLSMRDAIDAVKAAYSAYAKGRVQMPAVQHLDVQQHNGEVDIKSGFVEDFQLMGTKIASGFYNNQKIGLPPGIAVIVLLDLKTSMPLAIMDGTHVTAYRTGAAGAVAASVLAQKGSRSVGIVGTGTQGRMQLIALKELFHIQQAKVWNVNRSSAEKYRDQMSKMLSIDIEVVDTPGAVVPDVDILVTATPSKKALINEDVIHEGLHINAIGADGPGKQELDPKIMTRVSKIVVDSFEQCRKIGEIQHALRLGLINDSSIHAEIGEIINGNKSGRETESEVTIFDSTGLSAQDIAAAKIVFETARKKRLGKRVNLFG